MNVPESEESVEGSGEDQKLQFWTAFVNYANEHGRSSDIAKQKAAGRTYYDVHIGANGYHLFFSIPYGKRIKVGIYTYNKDVHFTSVSTAANFVTGASTNGMTAWKTTGGKTLKEAVSN